ncbi:hypothetical protein [Nitratifractor sp.]|uniref:hypothetical protein n=1 Tax=Nitratifractor sp. TaxID=2268144 RepID=UPI0025E208E4|nr:hypothetical protein [Nitratifractor sp.]
MNQVQDDKALAGFSKTATNGTSEATPVLRVFFFFASFPFSLSRNKEKEMKREADAAFQNRKVGTKNYSAALRISIFG